MAKIKLRRTPIGKAIDTVTNWSLKILEKGDEMTRNYESFIRRFNEDPDYRQKVGFKMLVGLASHYQAMEDVRLAEKYAEIMSKVRERRKEIRPQIEKMLMEKYGFKEEAPERKLAKVMRVEIVE